MSLKLRMQNPVRRREIRRLIAWGLLLALPMSVSSCDGWLTSSAGYEYFMLLGVGSSYQLVAGGIFLGYLSLSFTHVVCQGRYSPWSLPPIIIGQLLMGLLVFWVAGDWIYSAEGWFQKDFFVPLWDAYLVHHEGGWQKLASNAELPFAFHSKKNPNSEQLDGITPVALVGAIWWVGQACLDLGWHRYGGSHHHEAPVSASAQSRHSSGN